MTSRRKLLQAMAVLPVASSCSLAIPARARNYTPSGVPLRRVNVDASRVIRTVTGLRPFRRSGFVVNRESQGNKAVIHNYGHGGGGITLSWGSSQLAANLASTTAERKAAVLGCGVMGLTTARLLQDRGWTATIYSKDLPPNTTSNIAGGQWSPASVFEEGEMSAEFRLQFEEAMRFSYRYYQNLVGSRYGVRWISNYELSNQPIPEDRLVDRYSSMYPQLRTLGPGEHPFPTSYARHYDTMLIEPAVFLGALVEDFLSAGGKFEIREFASQHELQSLDQPVIMNCTGLGSRELFGDRELIPVKGQLSFILPQREVEYIAINAGTYMFPRSDGILLGGTFEHNVYDLAPNPRETQRILSSHKAFFSAMEDPWSAL